MLHNFAHLTTIFAKNLGKMVDTKLMKRILCTPYEDITDLDDALAKYKDHAMNVMGEKDDLSCSYFAKSNQTNRLGHSIRQHCMKLECSMADKEKIYKAMEELIQLGFDRASDILLDIAIQESLPNAVCGKFRGKSFQEMMNYEWFKNLIDTDYSSDIRPDRDTPNYKQEAETFSKQLYISTMFYYYLNTYNSPMLDEISHYRIFFKKDLRIATLRASQYMRSGKHKEAFEILSLFHIDMTQTTVSHCERETAILLAELYEYGLGTAPNLAQALSWYNYCYERFTMEAGYKAGRVCEKMGDYGKAMEWYRKVLDWKVLSPTSWERNYRKEDEVKSLLPYRLEISFRNLKKRMNPEGHDKISIAVKCGGKFSLRLKVLMNATLTIVWDSNDDKHTEVIKWKVNGWNQLDHQYSKSGKHEIAISSDEENVITGIEIETAFSVTKMNLEACKGLEYLHCTNQWASISPKGLCGLKYLNIRNTKTKRLNIRGMHRLVALDISENPSLRLVTEKYLPLRYLAMDGWTDLPKKTQLEENVRLNMGKIVPTIDIKRMETVHPTVFYYLRSNNWTEVRKAILVEEEDRAFNKEYFRRLYKMYKILCTKIPIHCPYPNSYLESLEDYLYICRWKREKNGRLIEYEDCEEETYIWNYSWSITLGTPLKDAANRQPFMMYPSRTNAYFAAMSLLAMTENKDEMENYGLSDATLSIYWGNNQAK